MKQNDLEQELMIRQFDFMDWMSVVSNHLGSITSRNSTEIDFYPSNRPDDNDDNYALKVVFSKNGNILNILPGPLLSTEIRVKIKENLEKTLLRPSDRKVSQTVGFSRIPLKTAWSLKDYLQILPMPTNAPTCWWLMGEHPFLLEFSFEVCGDDSIDMSRWRREKDKWGYFLNLVTRGGVSFISSQAHATWVFGLLDEHSKLYKSCRWALNKTRWMNHFNSGKSVWNFFDKAFQNTKYAQIGYNYDPGARKFLNEKFSPIAHFEQIKFLPITDYIKAGVSILNDQLDFPDNIEELTKAFIELDTINSMTFHRALYWYYRGTKIELDSNSASYISLITSIESFIEKPKVLNHCESCNQSVLEDSITNQFKTFVEIYAKGLTNSQKNALYKMRSDIVHGNLVLLRDIGRFEVFMTPKGQDEHRTFELCRQVVRIILINWLKAQRNPA